MSQISRDLNSSGSELVRLFLIVIFSVVIVNFQLVDNVVFAQQQMSNNMNASLPALSERAGGGINSRYLSAAASTASLAAATVVASNTVPQGGSSSGSSSSANQSTDGPRNYSHQHQQQSQQHQQPPNNQNNNNQVVNSNSINSNNNNQQQQASNQQPQQVAPPSQYSGQPGIAQAVSTPIMSTTFTFNPLIGQFVPTDLATGSVPQTFGPNGIANSGNLNNQNFYQQQQQQQQQQQLNQFQVPYSNSNNNINRLQPSRFTSGGGNINQLVNQQQQFGFGSNSNLNNLLQQNYNQQQQRQQLLTNQFNRRNGFNQNNPTGLQLPQRVGSTIVEDDSGFFQQQVANSGSYDQTGGNPNVQLDSLFVPNLPSNSYLLSGSVNAQANNNNNNNNNNLLSSLASVNQQGNYQHNTHNLNQNQLLPFNGGNIDQQQASILSQSSSSIAPISTLPSNNPTTTFNTAFSGAPNLVGLAEYRADQCVAADNRHGTCYQASECIKRGGTPMGKCGAQSNEYSGSSYVCCLFDVTCGQFAAERFVYFRNPNYPNTFDQSRMCRAKIGKLDKGICQFRLDLNRFDVAKPTNGNCSSDMFVVSGQNENYVIPKICGLNDGQHYYVGVDESGVITLHMMMMGLYRRSFEILITQIPCRSDFAAPAHCLQYYMGTHGTIKSFNYDDDPNSPYNQQLQQQDLLQGDGSSTSATLGFTGNPTAPYGINFGGLQQRQQYLQSGPHRQFQNIYSHLDGQQVGNGGYQTFGGYPNDLDYTMCIKKESGFCSITYQLSRSESGLQPFAVGHSLFGIGGSGLNDSWHQQPVSTECRDDYLLIGGVRLCSGSGGGGQYPFGSGSNGNSFSPYDPNSPVNIQFAQNGSILHSAGIGLANGGSNSNQNLQQQLQQLQQQYLLVQQQLARIQQQQVAAGSAGGNVTYANGSINNINNNNPALPNLINAQQQQQVASGNNLNNNNNNNINGNSNLEQQQAALLQQSLLIQQQMQMLASVAAAGQANGGINRYGNQQNNGYGVDGNSQFNSGDNFQGAIITDTTPGPFILRFVSNLARNARGFHIDYRQNPCK